MAVPEARFREVDGDFPNGEQRAALRGSGDLFGRDEKRGLAPAPPKGHGVDVDLKRTISRQRAVQSQSRGPPERDGKKQDPSDEQCREAADDNG